MQGDEIISAILNGYEQDRERAESAAFSVREKLLENPDYSQIFYKIKELNLQIARAEFEQSESGDDMKNREKIETLKKERELKKKELEQIAVSTGVSPKKTKPEYLCPFCNDSGRTQNGERCSCFFPRLIKTVETKLNIETYPHNTFDLCFSDENSLNLKKQFKNYCEKFGVSDIRNLVINGGAGRGKTFFAECIASELTGKGKSVVFLSAIKFNDVLLEYYKSKGSDKKYIFDYLTATDLLVIDDLGTEPILSNVTVEYLTAVISERIIKQKAFIITTNLSFDETKTKYTDRLSSRLSENNTRWITLKGDDKRRMWANK